MLNSFIKSPLLGVLNNITYDVGAHACITSKYSNLISSYNRIVAELYCLHLCVQKVYAYHFQFCREVLSQISLVYLIFKKRY